MYGMINKAIERMVCSQLGPDIWRDVLQKSGATSADFVSLNQYPDRLTYALIEAASVALKQSPTELLRQFGQYWICHTAEEGYGEILRLTGRTLPEFLRNLDTMHARIGLSFPGLQPPSFECTEIAPGQLRLRYRSARPGLEPMVLGLLEGVCAMFKTSAHVHMLSPRDADGVAEFQINIVQ